MLSCDNRVKILANNEEVFEPGRSRLTVRSEVCEWLQTVKPGANWHTRSHDIRSNVHRIQKGLWFYFDDRNLAMLFKLTWSGL